LHWPRLMSWYGSGYLGSGRMGRSSGDMDAPVLPRVEHGAPSRTLITGFGK
jgi:hypothetical protein